MHQVGFYYIDIMRWTVNKTRNISIKFELLTFPRKQVSSSHHESVVGITGTCKGLIFSLKILSVNSKI